MVYNIKKIVFILSWPRTGHTLVRDLLNLHENIVFSNENYDIFDLFLKKKFYNKCNLYKAVNTISKRLSKNRIRPSSKNNIEVIGNASLKSSLLLNDTVDSENLFFDFQNYVGLPIYFLICYRNPFDIISSIKLYYSNENRKTLNDCIDFFETIMKNINFMIKKCNYHIIYYDRFINNTKEETRKIMNFLDLKYDDMYLNEIFSFIVNDKQKRRYGIRWSKKQIARVMEIIENSNF